MNIKVICENQRQGLLFTAIWHAWKDESKRGKKGDRKGRKYNFSGDQTIAIVHNDRTLVRFRNNSIHLCSLSCQNITIILIQNGFPSKLNNYSTTSFQHWCEWNKIEIRYCANVNHIKSTWSNQVSFTWFCRKCFVLDYTEDY